jgi:hypothetical protein
LIERPIFRAGIRTLVFPESPIRAGQRESGHGPATMPAARFAPKPLSDLHRLDVGASRHFFSSLPLCRSRWWTLPRGTVNSSPTLSFHS